MMDLKTLAAHIEEKNPLQGIQLKKALGMLTAEETNEAGRTLAFFEERAGYTESEAIHAYLWLMDMFMEAQIGFKRTGRYPHSSFAEIAGYYKDEKMMRDYVVALAMTLYTLPQHIKVMRFFKESIKSNPGGVGSRYLEIGPGHGSLFVTALENSSYSFYTAVDIANASVDMTEGYAKYCVPQKGNYEVVCGDFFEYGGLEKFGAVVMGEVLEHVEQPERFLKKIHGLAADDAFIYITTAVNAPFFDHIYQFHTVEEVEEMFARCGFFVKDKVYGIAGNVSFEKAVRKTYTIVPAYVLGKM